jgi:hypothetical protein
VNERQEVVDVSVVPDEDASIVLKPGKEPFDFPAMLVSSQRAAVLGRRLDAVVSVRRDHFNALAGELLIEDVAVVGAIADQANGSRSEKPFFESIVNKGDFVRRSRRKVDGERKTRAVCHCHELRTFAPLGFSDPEAPFFAIMKVASM